MRSTDAPVPASSENTPLLPAPDGERIDGGEGQGSLGSAIGDDNLKRQDNSDQDGESNGPIAAADKGTKPPRSASSSPQMNENASPGAPEAEGVPNYLKDLYMKRMEGRPVEDFLGEKRDADGKILRAGLSPSMVERNKGEEFSSVIKRIRIADKLTPGDTQKLRHEIGKLPQVDANDVSRLRMYVDMMRGNVPRDGTFERVLSGDELRALKEYRFNQGIGSAGASTAATLVARRLPALGVLLGFFGLASARKGQKADQELEMRRKGR